MADEIKIINDEQFKMGQYLSPSQIEIIKSQAKDIMDLTKQPVIVQLMDSFIESNGTRTAEYTKLFETMKQTSTLLSSGLNYPEQVKQTLPLLYYMAYYDLLVLVGIISEEDIIKMQGQFSDMMGGVKKETPKA